MAACEPGSDVYPAPLSGKHVGSFAYRTITDRLPVILTRVVDHLFRERNQIIKVYGEDAREATKTVIGRLSKLRNEMQTDKIVLPLTSGRADVALWNAYRDRYIECTGKEPKWFECAFLYVECYMYRRFQEALDLSPSISSFDPFREQKCTSLIQSLEAVVTLSAHLQRVLDAQKLPEGSSSTPLSLLVQQFIQVALWGNMCDLSISAGSDNSQSVDPLAQLENRKTCIISDDTPQVLVLLQTIFDSADSDTQLHLVLDNAGFELFTDLCLVEFLQSTGFFKTVHLYVKVMPWFVSDTTEPDIFWLLNFLRSSQEATLAKLGKKWLQRIEDGNWVIENEQFWTLPHDFSEMKTTDPQLYSKLANADLVLFKGDLNYRKLVGDRMWEATTPFRTALRGFSPSPVCALRTVKSDPVVGLKLGRYEGLSAENIHWFENGEYAVVQYSP